MNVSFRRLSQPRSKPFWPQALTVGFISAVSLLSGFTPSVLPQTSGLQFNSAAQAQTVSAAELRNYAQSVLSIEPIRQTAYNEIKRISNSGVVPAIACHRPSSLNSLNRNIREIAINYCNRSIEIVESNDLTITRFNAITSALQNDDALQSRIQEEMIRIQQNGAASAQ